MLKYVGRFLYMVHTDSLSGMGKQFLSIWIPVFLTQLSLVAGSFFAATMSGQHGVKDLAGVAVGVNLWIPIIMTSIGLFMGITPIISHLIGANKTNTIPTIIRQSIYLAGSLGILTLGISAFALKPILTGLHLDPEVQEITFRFLQYIGIGIIPTFISITLRNAVDAHGYTRISLAIMSLGFIINIFLNYCFIYGQWNFPELGGTGTGIAISISNTFNCLAFLLVFAYCPPFKSYRLFDIFEKIQFHYWREQLKMGLPIGAANFLEISLFSVVGLLITGYGTEIIAAHQSANNFAEVTYTLPLSSGIAATILCGFELGAGRKKHALRYARMGQIFTVVVASIIFLFALGNMEKIAALYTSQPHMIPIISSFLPYALGFIFADATGTPIQGALRGYKDVNFVFRIAFLSYWIIGLGGGLLLAQNTTLGPYSYWVGIIGGLLIGSICYNLRLLYLNQA